MSTTTFFIALILLFVGGIMWGQYSWKDRALVFFIRPDSGLDERKVHVKSRQIKFGNMTYVLNPQRRTIWMNKRGLNAFFPFPVFAYLLRWDSQQPLDPKTFLNTWDTPEARESASSEKDWKDFNAGVDSQLGKKQSGIAQYLPWVAIGLVVIVGFLVYQQMGKMGVIEEQIQNLGKMIQAK